ncbi:OLC1v1010852C1 [Oldenlandia corymbosa var. corymbosa]|uniref:OLC1v1010852C1 n=1 Tax=Oldenlandia corymbosa var. corymbosa TaxID=529605 RepID=A0AAV1DVR0_OLDCO|nr:OLC1v1010852C1 [Oldenlandia corymbosa var. corymbosa]
MGLLSIIRKIKRKEKEMRILMTDGLVWVVDSSDLRRLDDCKYELHNLLKEERLSGASLLIFANKQDIQGSFSPDEIAKVLDLEAMDNSRHWRIVGCSAYTGEGLLEGFDWLVQDIASRFGVLDQQMEWSDTDVSIMGIFLMTVNSPNLEVINNDVWSIEVSNISLGLDNDIGLLDL